MCKREAKQKILDGFVSTKVLMKAFNHSILWMQLALPANYWFLLA